MHIPGLRRSAIDQIGLCAGGKLRQHWHCGLPLLGDDLTDWKTFTGVIYRWFQHLREGKLAMSPLHLHKGIDSPRHGHRAPAVARYPLEALALEGTQGGLPWTTATAIDAIELAICRTVIQQKGVSSDTGGHRLHHAQGQSRSDSRIKRIAAFFQDCHTSLDGQWLAGGNH